MPRIALLRGYCLRSLFQRPHIRRFASFETHPYSFAKSWMMSDLKAAVQIPTFSYNYKAFRERIGHLPPLQKDEKVIADALQQISQNTKNAVLLRPWQVVLSRNANRQLRELFIETFCSEETYQKKLQFFLNGTSEEVLKERIQAKNPLHTFDYICQLNFQRDNQINTAASLTKAALDLSLQFDKGDYRTSSSIKNKQDCSAYQYVFGASITSGIYPNKLHIVNNKSCHVVVLCRGQIYKLNLFNDAIPLSVDEIRAQLQAIKTFEPSVMHAPIGALSAGDRRACFESRRMLEARSPSNKKAFSLIDDARFIVCLDNKTKSSSTVGQMYLGNYQNHWYGATQIVVTDDNKAAFLCGYLKGVEGTPAVEVADEIVRNASKLEFSSDYSNGLPVFPEKIHFDLNKEDVVELEKQVTQLYHSEVSDFHLDIGKDFFTKLRVSPQVALNAIIMLAVREMTGKFPVLNHAISLRALRAPAAQIDWLYFFANKLEIFYSEFQKDLLSNENKLELLLGAISHHQVKMLKSMKSTSPTFYFQKPSGDFYDVLSEFFLEIGRDAPGYRNYLFRAYRTNQSMDVMSSSLSLPSTINLVGRPGSVSEAISMFGLHIIMQNDSTQFVFIPNRQWVDKLEFVWNRIAGWANHFQALAKEAELEKEQDAKEYYLSQQAKVIDTIKASVSLARNADQNRIGYPRGPHNFWSKARQELGVEEDSVFDVYLNNAGIPEEEHTVKLKVAKTECQLISIFANFYGLNPDEAFGYVTSGGAEGNFAALWWHRQDLENKTKKVPVVFISEHAHVAVFKSLDQLRIPYVKVTASVEKGIDMAEFEKKIQLTKDQFIIFFATLGTTTHGAIDDVPEAKRILEKYSKHPYSIHADAALLGAVLPITKPFGEIPFFDLIDTLVISGHKFFGTSEICGLVLARKSLQERVAITYDANYMNLKGDITPFSSRSGRAVLEFYFNAHKLGLNRSEHVRLKILLEQAFTLVEYFHSKMKDIVGEENVICNPYQFNIVFPRPVNEDLIEKYGLMPIGENQVSVCMLPGIKLNHLEQFFREYSSSLEATSSEQYSFRK